MAMKQPWSSRAKAAIKAWSARRELSRLDRQMIKRLLVDAVLVNVSLAVALFLRYLVASWVQTGAFFVDRHLMESFLRIYLQSAWLLTLVSLPIFYLSGFYTRGSMYISRYKPLIIIQAVTLAYLAFGSLVFLAGAGIGLPRSVLPVGWIFTLASVGGVRFAFIMVEKEVLRDLGAVRGSRVPDPLSVLVVGGAGYIGSVLVRKLLERGWRVRVLDRLLYGEESLSELYGREGFELLEGDFRNVEAVVRAVQGMGSIIHLGAVVGDPACALNGDFTFEVNLAATRMIAEAGKGYGIRRFLFASSCSVYGARDETLDERSSLAPLSLYASTKIESERLLLSLVSASFSPVLLRFATVCGLSPRPRFDLVVNLLAAQAAREGKITIYGGQQWRPFVHVEDVALALIRGLEAPLELVSGEIFNVGSEKGNLRLIELGELIGKVVPGVEVSVRESAEDPRNYRVSFEKMEHVLGFAASKSVEDAVQEIVQAVSSGQITDYRRPQYSNVQWLTENGETAITMVPNIYSVVMRTAEQISAPS
jgi:nucleoside-diphosphate-sugar epimerase